MLKQDATGVSPAKLAAARGRAVGAQASAVEVYEVLGQKARALRVRTTLERMRVNETPAVVDLSRSGISDAQVSERAGGW